MPWRTQARRTAIFDIVGERRVVNALSIDSMSHTVGRMIGPFVGGFLVEHVAYLWPHYAGYTWTYVLIVAMHMASMALAIRVRIPPGGTARAGGTRLEQPGRRGSRGVQPPATDGNALHYHND